MLLLITGPIPDSCAYLGFTCMEVPDSAGCDKTVCTLVHLLQINTNKQHGRVEEDTICPLW